ncbi:uncharacterized protein GGS22DRAFT_130353 [Annulohypoxylon maeteangense]|uniref:uncharacterized protein n=1 Tax=Annulohypoxylon maeteangense TaxID=1927788 RepID=UPI0020077D38|nr:uncharacterized protein GGS22DRAFT_130353 [Annulohypoxylon maeteangense]KAI0885540.1 hypothetical protein GGS22DRAFT_130353 [Annulohypoxylon maeteangense]
MTPLSTAFAAAMLLLASFTHTVTASAHGNLSLFDDAALHNQPSEDYNPGIGPRYFVDGLPPVPALWPPTKAKRLTPQGCNEDFHPCLEVGSSGAGVCCRNDQYCFLDDKWEVKCCGLGVMCNSTCPETLLYCNSTLTTSTTINSLGTTTIAQETSLISGCCDRACSSSSFLCQGWFGGQCCPYGANCISGGACSYPPTSTVVTRVTPAPSGCTTSQIACETGGGCCNIGSTCTSSVLPTTTLQQCGVNLTVVDTGGLSEGARVGIGVGVAVGAAVIIGAVTWFWINRRRKAKSALGGDTLSGSDNQRMENLREPFIPYTGTNSDITSPSSGMGMRPRLHETGLTYEYYGPNAVRGPYTDSSMFVATEPRSSPGFSDRAATAASGPEHPEDIVQPVEIDTRARREPEQRGVIVEKDATSNDKSVKGDQGPFELVGSPGPSPPPMNEKEAEQQRSRAFSPLPPPPPEANGQEGKEAKK